MTNPNICVLETDGANCEEEMAYAFEVAGADARITHVNELRFGEQHLRNFGALAIPGGFSYGDDIASGKVWANELAAFLGDQIEEFIAADKPVLGVCNGFQVLVRAGLLPYRRVTGPIRERQTVSLTHNTSGRFNCRWVELAPQPDSACVYMTPELAEQTTVPMQVAHGEGRFVTQPDELQKLEEQHLVVFRFADAPHVRPPYNPNGSMNDIAGICDPSGLILGMMPHPERSGTSFHPYRARTEAAQRGAQALFSAIVAHARTA